METCQVCSKNEVSFICVCEEMRICDSCLVIHVGSHKGKKHRPVGINHPLLGLLQEANEDINNATEALTNEDIETQIKTLERYRDQNVKTINQKIEDLRKKITPTYKSPPKVSHRKSASWVSQSEKTQKYRYSVKDNELLDSLKIVVTGESQVGKSALIASFAGKGNYFAGSQQMSCITRKVVIDNNFVNINIWEVPTCLSYKSLGNSCYFQSNAVIFTFDLSDSRTFQAIENRILDANREVQEKYCIIILGTKLDYVIHFPIKRQVEIEDGQKLARKYGGFYEEVNTSEQSQVIDMFKRAIKTMYLIKKS